MLPSKSSAHWLSVVTATVTFRPILLLLLLLLLPNRLPL